MDKEEIVGRICTVLPKDTLSDNDIEVLRFGVRIAIDFENFIVRLPDVAAVEPDIEVVRRQILGGLEILHRVRNVSNECIAALGNDPYEQIEYANESTVAGAELFTSLQDLASQVAHDKPTLPLRWKVYPSLAELRTEYVGHVDMLRSIDSTAEDRVVALLNTIRLQFIFLGNTFC